MWGSITITSESYKVELSANTDDFKTYTMPSLTFKLSDRTEYWDSDIFLIADLYPYIKKMVNGKNIKYNKEYHDLMKECDCDEEELYKMFKKSFKLGFFKEYKK